MRHEMVYNDNCKEEQQVPNQKEANTMSNQSMEIKVKELLELKRMKEELEAEIAAVEDEIKAVIPATKHKPTFCLQERTK